VIVEFKYAGQSAIVSGLTDARMAFATNTLREASYFGGELARPLLLREALGALYQLVVSDLKYRPRDRPAFVAWLAEQDQKFLDGLLAGREADRKRLEELSARMAELGARRSERRKEFREARRGYFEWAYTNQYELEMILDPVITVHPDELAFEAFSRDESSYGRVAVKYDLFSKIDGFECGTTNVDFSTRLHRQLARMRSYRQTRFDLNATGFTVAVGEAAAHKEKRIDLPATWVNGFLEVQSAMALSLAHVRLQPIDVFNILRVLNRKRARTSPRALRWELRPGRRTRVVFEPWEHKLELSPATVYAGDKEQTIRTWGRDRLRLLERILPSAAKIDVYLAGHGLPTIYVCDLSEATFTLALSGWTDNDWTGAQRFALLSRRLDVGADDLATTYNALRERRYASVDSLAQGMGLGVEKARSALSTLCQAGRAMYDLSGRVYRHRDLFLEPFSPKTYAAKAAAEAEAADPKAKAARAIFEAGNARMIARRPVKAGYKISGSAKGADGERVRPLLSVDSEGQIIEATCTCAYFKKYVLTKGPCDHVLALRLAHMHKLAEEQGGG
jgi:hypothetical protein